MFCIFFQISIFYGARSNAELLVHNGFVYPENDMDRTAIKLGNISIFTSFIPLIISFTHMYFFCASCQVCVHNQATFCVHHYVMKWVNSLVIQVHRFEYPLLVDLVKMSSSSVCWAVAFSSEAMESILARNVAMVAAVVAWIWNDLRSKWWWTLHQARQPCVKNDLSSGQGLNWMWGYVMK